MRIKIAVVALVIAALCSCGAATPAAQSDPAGQEWARVEQAARGTTVNLFMWGGDAAINRYITDWVAPRLAEQHAIILTQTPLGDTAEAVNKLLGEKAAGRNDGSIDLVWVNGENYRTLRQGELLYGPWARELPSADSIAWEDPSVAADFGQPVDGYEAPWGRARFVLIYDSARVPEPPRSLPALLEWARANPGRFTYPAPPDFTGSAFVRHVFYGGRQAADGAWSQAFYDTAAPRAIAYLNQLKPYQWRGGDTFPQSVEQLNTLYAGNEVDFSMSYNPAFASGAISNGTFPPTTRTYVLDEGTLANTHYLAIPFNAPNKAGAMVAANFLESPAAQIEKAKPDVWGDPSVLAVEKLSAEDQAALEALPRGDATLSPEELAAGALAEPGAEWVDRVETDWQQQVLAP